MKPGRKTTSGVSLLEIMIVLAIMALIAGVAAPRVIGYFGRAKTQTAAIQLSNIKGAIQLYYIDLGRFPSEAEGLQSLVSEPPASTGWKGPYLDGAASLNDPWGRPVRYRHPGQTGDFDLFSLGRDGQPGGVGEDADINL